MRRAERHIRRRTGGAGRTGGVATALTLVLTCGLTACGTGGDDGDPSSVSGSVVWWDTSGPTEAPFFNRLVADFEKQHPKIDVTYVSVDFFEAQQKYRAAAESGTGVPDVLRADVGWTAGFAADGLLADLTGTPALADEDDFLETTRASVTYDGGTYGVPQVTDTLALLYNRRLFEEAGITRPPASWKDLEAAALTVKEETGADGFAFNTDAYYSLPFLYGEGGDLLDPAASRITVADDAAVRGARTAAGLVASGAARKPPAEGAYDAMRSAFARGEVAMVLDGPWATADLFSGGAFEDRANLGIAPVPAGSAGTAGSPTGGHNLVVSADTEHPEAAALFVGHMTAAAQQERVALELGLLPTRKTAYTREVLSDPVRNSFYFAHTKSVPRLAVAESAELFASYEPHWGALLRGEAEPREALTATAEEWRATLLPTYGLTP
ncbi:extracellular solute-binding protein [Streptomyces sp. TRM 70351]|uniref:extracellular solute-binding protein n=1 Tax=Streptomyces sp. TRM 70351 TaxID=3116552 RepID=UPI002E7AB02D|nr:extracellular solute-binding protein [Streptomyces sp. TRM 70351]MEE1928607.1 extracellular solute-binding protein [Streptomyces sp. TRM 70351]